MVAARNTSNLLEREHELDVLHRAWRQARAGHGSAWVLSAEAGGGKTRLVTELLRVTGGRALLGAAEPLAPPEPYLAVSRAVPGFTPAPTRAESVARALAALEQAAGADPVVVFFDDLHFADDGTEAVVLRLTAECAARPWLVLAACRPGEGPATLQPGLTETVAQGRASRLDLPPLSREAVGTLIRDVRGATGTPADLETIYADSGGNPWFAEALARGNGAVSTARDRISLRLDRLEAAAPGALRVVRALAPATRPLPHAVAAELCGGDAPAVRQLLGSLRDVGVLRETEDGAWEFRHELLRRSVLEMMIAADRRDAHRALAEAFEGRRAGAAELAMHFAAAGDARAVPWALRAADEAHAVDAHVEAMAQLERALGFELEPAVRRSALQTAALEAHTLGRFAASRHLAEEAIAIPGGEPEDIAYLHWIAARAVTKYDKEADEAHLAAGERALVGRPISYALVRLAVARANRAMRDVEPEHLAEASAHALHLARACAEPEAAIAEFEVRRGLVQSALYQADPAAFTELETLLQFAADCGLEAGHSVAACIEGYNTAVISLFHREAAGLHERAIADMRRFQFDWLSFLEPYRALELVQRGLYGEARAYAPTRSPPGQPRRSTVSTSAPWRCTKPAPARSTGHGRCSTPPGRGAPSSSLRRSSSPGSSSPCWRRIPASATSRGGCTT